MAPVRVRGAVAGLCLALLAGTAMAGVATAQPKVLVTDGQTNAKAKAWDGIWDAVGGLVFDPKEAVPGKIPEEITEHPPYNAEWQAKYDAIKALHAKGIGNDPLGNCMPHGMPRLLGGAPGPIEIIVKPGEIYLAWEYMNQIRRIYTSGRPHPPADELYPMHFGDSIGHWEGDTLVVDTVSMMDSQPFDRTGAVHSDQMHVVERIHMVDPNTLHDDVTVTDPVAFTRPWQVTRVWKRAPANIEMHEFYCDLQRNPIVNGQTQVLLPGDPGYAESIAKYKGEAAPGGPTAVQP